MEAAHETTTTIDVEARLYVIRCSCGERTKLRLCGGCKRRPVNDALGSEVCTPCANQR